MQYSIRIFRTERGREPFTEWLSSLDKKTQAIILRRIDRVANGNLGDVKGVGEGVLELRIHFGSGYRVYFTLEGKELILLLTGSDKDTQSRVIREAIMYRESLKGR